MLDFSKVSFRRCVVRWGLLLLMFNAVHTVPAQTLGFADTVVEFFDSGEGTLPGGGPQGGVYPPPASSPTSVSLSVVLGDDPDVPTVANPADYLSLPQGSFVTVGFSDDVVFDGPGNDIFINEVGDADELADIYVSSQYSTDPADFVFIGQANGNTISGFDLAAIGFAVQVRAVKIVGLGLGGAPGAPGFDLANVEALNFEGSPDEDGDGLNDNVDNCIEIANADQRDTNGDGIGNACDADLNGDCIVNAVDLGLLRLVFFSPNADADFNGDNIVNAIDLGIFKVSFFAPPGPSGLPNACDGALT